MPETLGGKTVKSRYYPMEEAMNANEGRLLLKRQVGESIIAVLPGGLVTIKVIEVRGDKVRLGVHAPDGVPVNRSEVQRLIELGADGQDLKTMTEEQLRAAHVRGVERETR
jgi:carbon storage regulator